MMANDQAVLIKFYADWCRPCKALSPIVENIISKMEGISLVNIDIDENVEMSRQYQVRSIPTLILFKNDKEVGRLVGLQSTEQVRKFLEN